MKKILLSALMVVAVVQLALSQDLKKVQTNYLLTKYEDAKAEIDKVMADPKQQSKTEAIYWKAKVYGALYKNAAYRGKTPSALKDATDALQAYIAADPQFAMAKEKGVEPFFDVYGTSFADGVKAFNEKKWDEAADDLKTAVEYSDMIFKNKWTSATSAFDTTSILYTAYAYQNGKKFAEAAKYYDRLADNKVGGDSYIDIYKFLLSHYTETKDRANFDKYAAIAKELYPKGPWEDFETDYMDKNMTLAEKTAMYDKGDASGNMTEMQYLQFGDMFMSARNKDKSLDSAQQAMYGKKAADAFKKAYAKNNQNALAAYNVGIIYYNDYIEYDDHYAANIRAMRAINADKPTEKDPKKKAALDAQYKAKTDPYLQANAEIEKPLMENLNTSLDWLEKTYNILKDKTDRSSVEKNVINKTVDFLANLYAYKRDRNRGKDPKLVDEYDAKFKIYDALHEKF